MNVVKIAVLENNIEQSELILKSIKDAGYECCIFFHQQSMFRQLRKANYNLLILARNIRNLTDPESVKWIRSNIEVQIPILFLANYYNENFSIDCLLYGADDYIVKPLKEKEFIARINVLLRRANTTKTLTAIMKVGPYKIDKSMREIQLHNQFVDLTEKEYEVALFMFCNIGRLLSREHMLEAIWSKANISTRTVDTHASRIRNKLMLNGKYGFRLVPVYSLGYRLESTIEISNSIAQNAIAISIKNDDHQS